MLVDRYGLTVSTSSAEARDAYVAGADCVLAGIAGFETHLERALALDPQFAIAEAALARGLFVVAEVKRAREHIAAARAKARTASAREQSHVNAIALAIEGKPADALAATRAHLADHPRDAMVLAPATGVFGLIGFSGRPEREEEQYELLAGLASHYGDDWWFRCVHAFAASESGRLDIAWPLIEASMAANPANAHGAHIKVHVLYERGETAAAYDYLEHWMPGFDRRGLLHCHLSWHVALCALGLGKTERAWEVYRNDVHPGGAWGPPINIVSDAPAFLWRSELAGAPRHATLWREVQAYALGSFPKAGLAFADVHLALCAAANGDTPVLDRLLGEIRERIAGNKYLAGEVVPELAEGFAAYARGEWTAAIEHLERALPQAVRIGGSRAQRDIATFTLVAAYLGAGRLADARGVLARERIRAPAIAISGWASDR